jgi:Arc/MetJ family transcription regulator
MAEQNKRKKWSDVKARLEAFDHKGLVSLLGELYAASVANRRFLHSRLTPGSRAIEEYRRLVARATYPDSFSTRRVSVRDAAAAIVEYRRSTGDAAGTVDLMLTFVEWGTEQAADLGYGDEAYFDALQIRLEGVAKEYDTLPADVRAKVRARLGRIQVRAQNVGWGFTDAVDEVLHAVDVDARAA